MRTFSTALRNFLASGRAAWMVDLWTIQLVSGTVIRWTNADIPITWGGNTYTLGPGLERSRLTWRIGIDGSEDADQLRVMVIPRPVDQVGSTPLAQALHQGDFDGALVSLSRAYGATPGAIVDVAANLFTGRIGGVEAADYAFMVTVLAPTAELDAVFPRNVLQPQCGNLLFDETCGLSAGAFQTIAQVTGSINAARTSFATGLPDAAGYFTLGRFKFRSGANAGRWRYVRTHTTPNGVLTFAAPWPGAIAVGDIFEIYPGCDKRQATCSGKFSNIAHFRGAPFVPAAETTT